MSPRLRSELLTCYLTLEEVAKQVGKHPRTILRWTKQPNGLPFTTMGKVKLTTSEWWNEWLVSRRKVPNPERRRRR
jgi:hypothetical protein